MQISRVAVCDYRSFQGLHEIDLAPRAKYGRKRPIVLFGGLNGAGKTTILTAVRLALYGKLAIDPRASRKDYEYFLAEAIHKNPSTLIPADNAYVEIEFDYGRLGERQHFRVQRAWTKHESRVDERLRIWRDQELVKGIAREDAQAFLNELVPLGVSDLFFFDGEKIAELAEDRDGKALGDAIRRLVGIDLVDRLKADLGIYLRKGVGSKAAGNERRQLERLEQDYEAAKNAAREHGEALGGALEDLSALDAKVAEAETALVQLGGRWAEGRADEQKKIDDLSRQTQEHQATLRESAHGLLPLALTKSALKDAVDIASSERDRTIQAKVHEEIQSVTSGLLDEAKTRLSKKGLTWLENRLQHVSVGTASPDEGERKLAYYEASPRELESWTTILDRLIPDVRRRTSNALKKLEKATDALEVAAIRLERAPDEESLESALATLREAQAEREECSVRVTHLRLEVKEAYRQAIQLGRELKRLEERLAERTATERPIAYARAVRRLLDDYGTEVAKRKVTDLEEEFSSAFQRLARKEDMLVRASIDPETYQVSLLDQQGNTINRAQLSAGERQIYAIAMLEALAHTSGRRLPVIIDTPLGRLDSHHRSKLVQHYFPRASHQVIILSTDTEVDQSFYAELSPDISHAYQINYEPEKRSSSLEEGYFWRQHDDMREAG